MEDRVKIKVVVAGRTYPLKVTPDEEEHVRKAVDFIEERIKVIEEKYDIKDIQDVQALILLELASELSYIKQKQKKDIQVITDKVDQLLQIE